MGQRKKSFDDRIKESEDFVKAGNLKSAISTLVKAKRDDPAKAKAIDLGKSIEGLQNRMDAEEKPAEKVEEKPAEKPDIELPVTDEKPDEKPEEKPVEETTEEIDNLNENIDEEKIEKVEDELKEEVKSVDPSINQKKPEDETKKDETKDKEIPDEDLDPDEIINFRVLRPFIMNKELQVTDKIVKLPRRRKNFAYVVALEDLEKSDEDE